MQSYYNKQLPNHFDDYLIPISSIHPYPTRLSTSNNLESTLLQENVPLHLLAQKYGLQWFPFKKDLHSMCIVHLVCICKFTSPCCVYL